MAVSPVKPMHAPSDIVPTLRTVGCVALIDDNEDFVFTLETLLASSQYSVVSFTEPGPLHAFLDQRAHLLAQEQALLASIWRAQLEPQGTVAIEALRFFARPERLEIPLVLVSDYAMPSETGLSVCARHRYPGFERILLTGVADTAVAVTAFNSGLIEQFVRKQSQSVAQDVASSLEGRLRASAERRGEQLGATLAPDLASALRNPAIAAALDALLAKHGVREYMMLGEPQGLLGVTALGQAVWIQLETQASLRDLDDVLQLAGADTATRERVARREALIAADFMQQVGLRATEAPVAVLSSADPVLVAAVHPLDLDPTLTPAVRPSRN
jgi:FixJ family two-component response regulator